MKFSDSALRWRILPPQQLAPLLGALPLSLGATL